MDGKRLLGLKSKKIKADIKACHVLNIKMTLSEKKTKASNVEMKCMKIEHCC